MRHLNTETLARLVDESASEADREHLASCPRCAAELRALQEQTEALGALPGIPPPAGDWGQLERRLEGEGLIRGGRTLAGRLVSGPGWLQAAAALLLFLGGTGVGAFAARSGGPDAAGSGAVAVSSRPAAAAADDLDEAARNLRSAEERYVQALVQFRRLQEASGELDGAPTDPASRFAALEALVAASQAAIETAPSDPFLNGVLVSTLAERQATLGRISEPGPEDWY